MDSVYFQNGLHGRARSPGALKQKMTNRDYVQALASEIYLAILQFEDSKFFIPIIYEYFVSVFLRTKDKMFIILYDTLELG